MKQSMHQAPRRHLLFPAIVLAAVLGMEALIWNRTGGAEFATGLQLAFWGIAVALAVSLSILAGLFVRKNTEQQTSRQLMDNNLAEHESLQHRLDGMVQLNQLLINSQSENELVEKALEIITRVVGCSGGSFIPYDDWGQPLQTYVYASQSNPGLQAWLHHLAAPGIRQRCEVCNRLHSEVTSGCPLLESPFTDVARIYCLPLMRNAHPVGVVNLYLPADREIEPDLHAYLVMLLDEMALALEMTRLRNQELVTFRQLQLANSQQEDLSTIVGNLIDGLREVLDFKNSRAVFRPAEPRFAGFELSAGSDPWLESIEANGILNQMANMGCAVLGSVQMHAREDGTAMIVLPFCLPEGTVIGAVLMTGARLASLQPRQTALIETVTTQVAMLVENERRRLETEYRTVIQERVRLAREIHDSLAQTLAYLKLTSAQMQTQLAQGDLARLAQNLQHSHEALSDAYLETRQVIDNLRFAPQQDMVSWLSQISRNFEASSGLKVVTALPAMLPQVNSEIQAQLVRIIQEALSNIRKHAQATTVWINVREWNGELVFDLSDDGVGFSAEDVPELSRHGLRGMRERAELIGAEFQITSHSGNGTTIHIEVPIHIQETPA
ncbi:MAG: GAF domain-containing sensor histidine kinase [Bellilinea sp.]